MFKIFRAFALLSILLSSPFSYAYAEEGAPPVSVELVSEYDALYSGNSQWIALHVSIDDPWYSYWKNPGDIGYPTVVEWKAPKGFSIGDVRWPSPEKSHTDAGIVYKHRGDFWVLAQLIPDGSSQKKEGEVSVEVRALVCSDEQCLPIQEKSSLRLPVLSTAPPSDSLKKEVFVQAIAKTPNAVDGVSAQYRGGMIELFIPGSAEVGSARFYPKEQGLVSVEEEPAVYRQKNGTRVLLKPAAAMNAFPSIQGDLVLEYSDGTELPVLISSDIDPEGAESSQFQGGVLMAVCLAFIGGMILNLMPCVLPVISIKIFGFVKMAGQKRSKLLLHGGAFTLGVLVSFWVLAALLLALQAYGHAVGWGFQLQEPIFVASLAAVMLVFSMSLFGVFELGTGLASFAGQTEAKSKHVKDGRGELLGSFFSGVLATAVATPCTGPFLGSAIGFAVTLPAFYSLLVFTSLGFGMAFPYLLISAFPNFIRFLPKPGNWMVAFKEVLGFIMLAATLWLMWVFAAQTGTIALFTLMIGFLCLAVGCWVYGKWGAPMNKKGVKLYAYVATMAFAAMGVYAIIASSALESVYPLSSYEDEIAMADASSDRPNPSRWEPYSEKRLEELRAQGVPVLIDFTARWCLICQVNHVSLSANEVEKKLGEKGVVKMLADWTRHDPQITRALAKYGRNGVPFYLLFGTDPQDEPKILPQVLTPDIVLHHLGSLK